MTYVLYNRMNQPVRHKGQICLGDIIRFKEDNTCDYKVIRLKEDKGNIKNIRNGYNFHMYFIEGKGWCWKT